jgi:hypothetical protein
MSKSTERTLKERRYKRERKKGKNKETVYEMKSSGMACKGMGMSEREKERKM